MSEQNYPAQIYTSDGNTWTVSTSSNTGGWDTNDNWIWTTDNTGGWSTGTTITTTWPQLEEVLPEEIRDKKFVGYLFIDDEQNICLYDSKQKKTTKIIDLKEGKELTTLMNVIAKMLLSEQD
jgi:hypothetical protein